MEGALRWALPRSSGKALGLPEAPCLLKEAQEAKGALLCPEQPYPSMLLLMSLNPATV